MTHRLDLLETAAELRVRVQGVVDSAALGSLRAAVSQALGRRTVVVIDASCDIDLGVVDELRGLEVAELRAESPYLARWLDESAATTPKEDEHDL
jgi:hypothetical protein